MNSTQPRTSISFFLSPAMDKILSPPEELVGEEHPRKYRDFTWAEFLDFTQNHHRPDQETLELLAKIDAGAPVPASA